MFDIARTQVREQLQGAREAAPPVLGWGAGARARDDARAVDARVDARRRGRDSLHERARYVTYHDF